VIRVTGGSPVEYDFSDSGTPVLGVSFDAKNDEGLVVAKVQVLSETPEDVPASSGNCYQMMSIDVGSEGTISSGNADNIMIRFKVSKQWMEENNIDVSTIRMTRYHGEQWNDLPTSQEREDGEYIYFYAETPGFSIFEVVGDEVGVVSEQIPTSSSMPEEEAEPVEEETQNTPGFTALAGIVFVSLALLVSRKDKSE
jgi:PGF-pre-PGF domain-containing protein